MIKTLLAADRSERERFKIPRSVQQSIPVQRIYRDGIWQTGGKFSRTWRFADINYALASHDDQHNMFTSYCGVLNSLPTDATTKITINNRRLNGADFRRSILMRERGDGLDMYRQEYNRVLTDITITPKTTDEMRTVYSFTRYQNEALDELLADRATLASLASSLTITNADAVQVLQSLPADLSPERKTVVQNALTLYGKVSYFWGGKSLVIGWDSRWGELRQVTAAGSSTTGTYRPYGLDCSGFVDWVFYNATGGGYIIGHGGGAAMQHAYCTDISWSDAQPGDLVFYPDNSHVGIVCGRAEDGSLLVIHCASGANNVVITGMSGFVSVARPNYYGE